jgi:aspartyl-tRNA(Asn)/glutamyl-tRNA(Gln) amidotransferase subunit A
MTELHRLGIAEIRTGLATRAFSAEEVVAALLAQIEQTSRLNAFTEILTDSALKGARALDENQSLLRDAPLRGVPIALKDNILCLNSRTTCASHILSNFQSPYDATVTELLKNAGAIILGKTNMDEFAMGSSSENSRIGIIRNPWDLGRVPGGSSGGSAAATIAECVPGALGTDTGGSVRQPASFCGLYGIKPTYGRVSRYGVVAFASSLDQVGCFARSAEDLALLTSAICAHDPRDSTSMNVPGSPFTARPRESLKGLRVGVPREYFIDGLAPEVESAVRTAIDQLKNAGAQLVEISLPHTTHAVNVYYVIAPAEASSNLARYDGIRYGQRASGAKDLKELYYRSRSEGFGEEVKRRIMVGSFVLSTGYYDAYYLRAQKVRTLIKRDFDEAFGTQCDLIACPVSPTTAFALGEKVADPISMYLNDVFTIPVNLAGLPGMSVPCGFDSAGLPIGLQLIGKPWDEQTLFEVAATYEAHSSWASQRPTGYLSAGHSERGNVQAMSSSRSV